MSEPIAETPESTTSPTLSEPLTDAELVRLFREAIAREKQDGGFRKCA